MADRYFVTYAHYSNDLSDVCYLVGETKEYYRVKSAGKASCEYMIRKSNLKLRGCDVQYYELSEEEVVRKVKRQKAIRMCEKTNFRQLTDSQLDRIRQILEEK